MQKYICTNCRAIYDPLLGDEESGIEPGTDFEETPEDWMCPICQSSKDLFMELPQIINEPSHAGLMNDLEFMHTPRYFIAGDKVIIRIGDENGYPNEPDHRIVLLGLYDEDGEVIDLKKTNAEVFEDWFEFNLPDDDFSVIASCNVHGMWKGFLDESLVDDHRRECGK